MAAVCSQVTLYLRNCSRFPPSPIRITPSLAISIFVIIIINIVIRAEGAQHTTSTTILIILISVFSIPVLYSTITARAEGA
jgi:hypothetical protein